MRVLVVMLVIGVLAVAAVRPASVLVERGAHHRSRRGLVGEGAIAADAVRVGRHGILLVTSGRRARRRSARRRRGPAWGRARAWDPPRAGGCDPPSPRP